MNYVYYSDLVISKNASLNSPLNTQCLKNWAGRGTDCLNNRFLFFSYPAKCGILREFVYINKSKLNGASDEKPTI